MLKKVIGSGLILAEDAVEIQQVFVGSYVGNGSGAPRQITGVGFEPDVVLITQYGDEAGGFPNLFHRFDNGFRRSAGSAAVVSFAVVEDGFEFATTATEINVNGGTFHFVALKTGSGLTSTFYFGDGSATLREIDGVGFESDWYWVWKASGEEGVAVPLLGVDNEPARRAGGWTNAAPLAVSTSGDMTPDGIEIESSSDQINEDGAVYFGMFGLSGSNVFVGEYVGNGSATARQITGFGFQPELVIVFRDPAEATGQMVCVMGEDDAGIRFGNGGEGSFGVSMLADGIEFATNNAQTNLNTWTYKIIAFRSAA